MNRTAYRSWVLALTLPLLGVGLGSGCSRQSEGEPCDFKGVDRDGRSEDCESGLICTSNELLQVRGQDRCCPPVGTSISDDRCTPRGGGGTGGVGGVGGTSGTGGSDTGDASDSGGAGGTAGESGSGGSDSGADGSAEACATPCSFSSQCADNLVCGPQGCCQPECLGNKDCTSPALCVAGKCEITVPDAATE